MSLTEQETDAVVCRVIELQAHVELLIEVLAFHLDRDDPTRAGAFRLKLNALHDEQQAARRDLGLPTDPEGGE